MASEQTLGPYRLIELIGSGSMGEVWRAEDTRDGQTVALKTLPDRAATSAAVRRFRREFRAARALSHPNIVQVLELHHSGPLFFTMQFVDGTTWEQQLVREREDDEPPRNSAAWIESRLRVLHHAALALEHIHAHGILHRDLKPSNILIGTDSQVRIADFGLARFDARPSEVSGAGTAIGTLAYMAPEQARGGRVDARSDIYALGAVLYESVTGSPPFTADELPAMMMRQLYDNPASPRTRNPELDSRLESLALRCLAKDPLHRPQSATELLAEIDDTAKRLEVVVAESDGEQPPALERTESTTRFASPLVGRETESRALRERLSELAEGGTTLVLIKGRAGVGKTRLVDELRVEATVRGIRFLAARCPIEARPLGAFAPALSEVARELASNSRATSDQAARDRAARDRAARDRVLGHDAAVLSRFVRAFVPLVEHGATLEGERSAAERVRAVWAAENVLRRLAAMRPTVLFLDGIQNADRLSLELLEQLSGQHPPSPEPLLILATIRTEPAAARNSGSGGPIATVGRTARAHSIELGALDRDDTERMLLALLGTPTCPRPLLRAGLGHQRRQSTVDREPGARAGRQSTRTR